MILHEWHPDGYPGFALVSADADVEDYEAGMPDCARFAAEIAAARARKDYAAADAAIALLRRFGGGAQIGKGFLFAWDGLPEVKLPGFMGDYGSRGQHPNLSEALALGLPPMLWTAEGQHAVWHASFTWFIDNVRAAEAVLQKRELDERKARMLKRFAGGGV